MAYVSTEDIDKLAPIVKEKYAALKDLSDDKEIKAFKELLSKDPVVNEFTQMLSDYAHNLFLDTFRVPNDPKDHVKEELAQRAYLKSVRYFPSFDPLQSGYSSRFYKICQWTHSEWMKKEFGANGKKIRPLSLETETDRGGKWVDDIAGDTLPPLARLMEKETNASHLPAEEILKQLLSDKSFSLTGHQKEVLRLKSDGLEAQEIAERLGCTAPNVNDNLYKIRVKAKKMFPKKSPENDR